LELKRQDPAARIYAVNPKDLAGQAKPVVIEMESDEVD
jgi:hypothetical protein